MQESDRQCSDRARPNDAICMNSMCMWNAHAHPHALHYSREKEKGQPHDGSKASCGFADGCCAGHGHIHKSRPAAAMASLSPIWQDGCERPHTRTLTCRILQHAISSMWANVRPTGRNVTSQPRSLCFWSTTPHILTRGNAMTAPFLRDNLVVR